MNSIQKYCLLASILWINLCSADENLCGQLEVQKPTILGRNVTFIFTPINQSSVLIAEWQRAKTGQWNSLPNTDRFVQYTEKKKYYLIVTNTSGNDGDLLYRTILRTRDQNCTSRNESLKLIVPPSQPVFIDLTDIDSCVNCIVGEDCQQIKVVCNTTGGSQPVNVTLTIYNETRHPKKDDTGAYYYSFYLRNQYHMHEAVCSVTNHALDEPLTATAVVYVTKPPVMQPFNVPNITKEGELTNIACVFVGGRPSARVFLRIGGEEILENVMYRNHTDTESPLTSATLTKFRKEWNNHRVSCCRSNPHYTNKTLCSESNPVQHLFPPESITITPTTYRIEDQDFYLVRSNCTIHNAHPACKPHWIVPNNLIFEENFIINKSTGDPDGGTDSLWEASFNVSPVHSGQLVVCRALCRDFNVTAQGSFVISIPEGEGHKRTVEKPEGSAPSWIAPVVVAVSLVAIVVVAVAVIVVRRMKNDKAVITENEAYEPFDAVRTTKPQRGNDESVPLQQEVLYSQVNKPKASDDLVTLNPQPAGEPQLVYAELAVGPPSQQKTSTSTVRRDSPTEYVGIDFAKTAEQQSVEKETVYANQ